ncbi:MAG: N-acetyltransferase [Pseudonocardiaceae bacterium]
MEKIAQDSGVAANFRIRPAEVADLNAVSLVDRESFGQDCYSAVVLRQFLDIEQDLFQVAENDYEILGYAIGAVTVKGAVGWILALAVSKSTRRTGIGAALVKKIVKLLDQGGVGEVLLTVEPDNFRAISLYRQLGFSVRCVVPDYFGKGTDRLLMAALRHERRSLTFVSKSTDGLR